MISLPLMNNLCKRWILPEHIQAQCDHYFLRNVSDTVLAGSLIPTEEGMFIHEGGVNFQVIFMYDAAQVYSRAKFQVPWDGKKEYSEPSYWCSFRSLSFEWNGETCTKSYVLIQVDKGRETKDLIGARAPKAPEAGERIVNKNFLEMIPVGTGKTFRTYADLSQPIERDSEEGGFHEEV